MKRLLAAALLLVAAAPLFAAQGSEKVIDVRSTRASASGFDALWDQYRKADGSGDKEAAEKLFREIRRLRIERNVESLEEIALALVGRGQDRYAKGDRVGAEDDFGNAISLDPHLPDAYLARAMVELRKGPLGIVDAVQDTFLALTARLDSSRGRYYILLLWIPVVLLALFATITVLALSLALRSATLLLHDLEERLGEERKPLALGIWAVLLLLPALTFQGFAWLPFWWLALLFMYLSRLEQAVALLAMLAGLAVGPAIETLEKRILAERNPTFRAAMETIENSSDARARDELEKAVSKNADDRDLRYLLGVEYKKEGRYDDSATLYRDLLKADGDDRVALNNLANIEFARGEFPAAIARYKQGAEQSPTDEIRATFYYNLSLAHLQRFEYQPAQEARSQAERLAQGLVRSYDALWKYDKGDYAVVDLALTEQEAWAKFDGTAQGIKTKNVAGKKVTPLSASRLISLNRFAGFLLVFALTTILLSRWRGPRMFTMRCQKCGTPFCKHCHLGAAGGLCTQCYHLFVVRDGVSGPARNQKLLEVQKEDERRERVFRALSLLSPGAGHLYAQRPLVGVLLASAWYALLSLALLAGRVLPVTEAPSTLMGSWGLVVAAVALLTIYIVANRARPDWEVSLPAPPRSGTRRARG